MVVGQLAQCLVQRTALGITGERLDHVAALEHPSPVGQDVDAKPHPGQGHRSPEEGARHPVAGPLGRNR